MGKSRSNHKQSASAKQADRAVKREMKRERIRKLHSLSAGDFKSFNGQLAPLGLKLRDMIGDGNCLFRSAADQLIGNAHQHSEVRAAVVTHMVRMPDLYAPFVGDDMPFDEYIGEMKENGAWGGQIELTAISRLYSAVIIIHQLNEPNFAMQVCESPKCTIHLAFHDEGHYSSVIPITGRTGAVEGSPKVPIVIANEHSGLAVEEDEGDAPGSVSDAISPPPQAAGPPNVLSKKEARKQKKADKGQAKINRTAKSLSRREKEEQILSNDSPPPLLEPHLSSTLDVIVL
eukprot:TRINITY_DN1944_c0_g1_i1.p1 TRINITY_DN1944_c0_g1~~TRINITY_DN1944_c0_g1_i1.p1  ORF type:complete len:288 (+),score=38.93 TRINITY_DN1944_c0_g1_i1:40-903(+)